jgi:xanthine/uracil permease
MSTLLRVGIIVYVIGLSLALVVGNWPLEGPRLVGASGHGIHVGDLGVVVATASACAFVARSHPGPPSNDQRPIA